jgi:Right handed beta helix region
MIRLIRCNVYATGKLGVLIDQTSVGELEDSDIHDSKETGIGVCKQGRVAIRRSRVHDNKNVGVYAWEGGRAELQDCDIYRNGGPGFAVQAGRISAEDCRINGNTDCGILATERSYVATRNCDLRGNGKGATVVSASDMIDDHSRWRDKDAEVQPITGGLRDRMQSMLSDCDVLVESIEAAIAKYPNTIDSTLRLQYVHALQLRSDGERLMGNANIAPELTDAEDRLRSAKSQLSALRVTFTSESEGVSR